MSAASTLIAAVDVGFTGAVAHLQYFPNNKTVRLLSVHDMPTAAVKTGTSTKLQILIPQLRAIMLHDGLVPPDVAVIEEVGAAPNQGVTSMFRFGYAAGVVAGVCGGLNIPTDLVRPQKWQAWAGVKKGDDAGRLRAVQLFPLQAHFFSRKKDHNRADAALIGYAAACDFAGGRATIIA